VAKTPTGPTDAEIPVTMLDNVQVVAVTADDTMHFNGNRFSVHADQPVRVELTNKGIRPPTEMEHNFVLLKPGTEVMTYNLASAQAKDSGYMPGNLSDKVLAFTAMAGPGQTVTTAFTAPKPGQYTFLCNFPGHYAAGMYGTMTVMP
jgi:azurin